MDELKFTLKVLVITIVLALGLQVKVGEQSVEYYAYGFITHSWLSERVQEVTAGGLKLAQDGYKKISWSLNGFFDREQADGNRKLVGSFKRSEAYRREKAEQAGEEFDPDSEK